MIHSLWFLVLAAFVVSCGTVQIKSTPPEADVLLIRPGKEEPKVLGKTPYSVDVSEPGDAVNDGTIALTLKKLGYMPKTFIVPNMGGGDLQIDANLVPNLQSNYQEVNKIISLLFRAERFVKQKRYEEATKLADQVKTLNENVAAAYHIIGTVLFLQNKLDKSRFEWIRALELDPSSSEAQTMLAHIEKKTGRTSSVPASTPAKKDP